MTIQQIAALRARNHAITAAFHIYDMGSDGRKFAAAVAQAEAAFRHAMAGYQRRRDDIKVAA